MKQARIIPMSREHPDGTLAEWFEFETIHGDHTHHGTDHSFKSREAAQAHLESLGYTVVD